MAFQLGFLSQYLLQGVVGTKWVFFLLVGPYLSIPRVLDSAWERASRSGRCHL